MKLELFRLSAPYGEITQSVTLDLNKQNKTKSTCPSIMALVFSEQGQKKKNERVQPVFSS